MKAVFTQALVEKRASAVCLLWRELRDWPGMVWRTHLTERRERMTPTSSIQAQTRPAHSLVTASSWRDACLAALAFLFYLWYSAAGVILSALSEPLQLTKTMQGRIGWCNRAGDSGSLISSWFYCAGGRLAALELTLPGSCADLVGALCPGVDQE